MFWGVGLFVMILTLIYTLMVYRLFRGRVPEVGYNESSCIVSSIVKRTADLAWT
jgi:hypothetical protein